MEIPSELSPEQCARVDEMARIVHARLVECGVPESMRERASKEVIMALCPKREHLLAVVSDPTCFAKFCQCVQSMMVFKAPRNQNPEMN